MRDCGDILQADILDDDVTEGPEHARALVSTEKNNTKKLSIFLACIFHEGRGTYFPTSRTVQPDSSIASRISTSLADFQSSRQGSSITIAFLSTAGWHNLASGQYRCLKVDQLGKADAAAAAVWHFVRVFC